jgi:hypothetical protein
VPAAVLGLVDHTYRNGDGLLSLIRYRTGKAGRTVYALNKVELTGTILGHPAKIGGPGNDGYRCAEWFDGSYLWQLCSIDLEGGPGQLSAAELLSIANSIR